MTRPADSLRRHSRLRSGGLVLGGAAIVTLAVGAFIDVQARLRPDVVADRAGQISRLAATALRASETDGRRVRREGVATGLSRAQALRWLLTKPVGLFVHYGPQSAFAAPSHAAWFRELEKLVAANRTLSRPSFAPDTRMTATWVAAAKAAGASYLTVVAKHHDGLCLWDSDVTTWDVSREHDLLESVSSQARASGLRLFVYYSLVDFHELTYANDRAAYAQFVRAQMRELLTRYGPIAGVWFDLPRYSDGLSRRQLAELYELIHGLQPWALIGANHHGEVLKGEDFQILEEALGPGLVPVKRSVPRQAAFRLGRTWFWSGRAEPDDGARFARLRAEAYRRGLSLLANVAPRPDGAIPQSVIHELADASS